MEAFFEGLLDELLRPAFLRDVQKKYHFGEEQIAELAAVAQTLLPALRREACWTFQPCIPAPERRESDRNFFCSVVVTLGMGPDDLQDQYAEQGLLSECYMAESLANELLLKSYAAYNRYVESHTKFHVARYHFPGSEEDFPLELLPGTLEELKAPVSCNQAFCMTPKKSVVFISELTEDASRRCQGICQGCGSRSCPNRVVEEVQLSRLIADMPDVPLTYGYGRIFGRW